MDYKKNQIKEGINLHVIQTEKFKTNIISIFLTLPLTRENITKEALISAVLRRGNMHYNTSEEMSIALEEMYGAGFDCGIEKMGDTHVLKFYIETVNEEFLPEKEDILKNGVNMLCDIVFNPLVQNNQFKDDYVEMEKNNLKQIIERKIDNKGRFALERCIEEMYKNKPYGLYKYGYVEDLENINSQNLYETYIQTIKNAKIDIFVSGKIENENVKKIILQNEQINRLDDRKTDFIKNEQIEKNKTPNEITEELNITQGKLVMGLTIEEENLEDKYIAIVYNTILGGGANSKLFQNVREKASLAYSAGSNYVRQKGNIFIRLGIETSNYNKAKEIIIKQLEDMKNGEFSEEELNNAKTTIISTIDFIPDEQDTQISYYFGQEFTGKIVSIEEYKQKIQNITKDQVVELAKNIQLHTTYFLRGKGE
jgi:predicted Zn-dependent peptidase